MLNTIEARPRWFRLVLIFGAWTLIGLCFAAQLYIAYSNGKQAIAWDRAVLLELTYWYLVALLSPAVLWLSRKFPMDRQHWLRSSVAHVLFGGLFSIIHSGIYLLISVFLSAKVDESPMPSGMELLRMVFSLNLALRFLTYSLIVTISHAFDYYQRFREGELRSSQLEASLAQAQLQALKMQLQPHFLFNALNSISALVHRDAEAADRMIAKLGHLLRLTLDHSGVHKVTLRQELEFLDCYLDIQNIRFRERLAIKKDIDPASLDAMVPHLILQPIVENAIGHGIEPYDQCGVINITSRRQNGRLALRVEDNGPGISKANSRGNESNGHFVITNASGIGLANTQTRLMHFYGKSYRFDLDNAPSGGLIVAIEIPFDSNG